MSNFKIMFNSPWLLLLLLVVIPFLLYTFFRVNKRFRYSRNKVVSFVMSLLCMISAIFLLSGMKVSYDIEVDNEIIIMVDSSDSNKENNSLKDEYVKEAIAKCPKNSKLGIIKFAADAVLAFPLSRSLDNAYDIYKASDNPLGITTNIECAFDYALSLLENPKMSKIIVLSDGIETDGNSKRAIANLALEGVKIDVLRINNKEARDEVMAVEVVYPNEPILIGKPVNLELKINSSYKGDVQISLFDNGFNAKNEFVSVKKGMNSIIVSYTFKEFGLHELCFKLDSSVDSLKENNIIYSYSYIENINDILILDRTNEGEALEALLKDDYDITRMNIKNAPASVNELRAYDEVILCNIANSDMNPGFDVIINEYVKEYGGGLITVGGMKEDSVSHQMVPNMYNREDMEGTMYQDMLPVIAEDYTPPVAVMLAIDVSGSMTNIPAGESETLMEQAKKAALAGLKALDPRDYVGIVAFHETAQMVLPLTPVANRRRIEDAIDKLDVVMKGTVYSDALEMAGGAVKALSNVNKKHIILISDGEPNDTSYIDKTEANLASGVTTSVISFNSGTVISNMQKIADAGNGRSYNAINGKELELKIKADLEVPEIREFEQVEFTPKPGSDSKIFSGVDMSNLPKLKGFYGTKLKNEAKAMIIGDFGQPIYATWSYGNGKVSSFMCDLNKVWSEDLFINPNGEIIIKNILDSLFPIESIKYEDIELEVGLNNTTGTINIYTKLNDGESLRLIINRVDSAGNRAEIQNEEIKNFKNSITAKFKLNEAGIYEIVVDKLDSNNRVLSEAKEYTSFSYSEEYNPFLNNYDNTKDIENALSKVDGSLIRVPSDGYNNLELTLNITYDMRYILGSIIIISFLVDVAVRKFKFKWPHEIIKKKNKEG